MAKKDRKNRYTDIPEYIDSNDYVESSDGISYSTGDASYYSDEYASFDGDDTLAEDYDEIEFEDEDYEEDSRKSGHSWVHTLVYLILVIFVSVILAVLMWFAADDVLALSKADTTVTITVTEDESFSDVAQDLKDHGLINYKLLFMLYGKFSHAESKIGAGTYELNQMYDYHALVNGLVPESQPRETVTLTFPEGYTVDQVFTMLAENGVCTEEELQTAAVNYVFDEDYLSDVPTGDYKRLEGFLFPDTYEFYVGDDADRVINKFISNFTSKISDSMLDAVDTLNADIRARMEEEGSFSEEEINNSMMTVYKVMTVASLIEKEAGSDSERTLISSVIYNRLTTRVHELLQIDATVEYALGEHKQILSADDLAIDSPYNTYKYEGLPPGPIANPGIASINAAIYPEDTSYFFYALDGTGTHKFFENYIDQQNFLNSTSTADTSSSDTADTADAAAADATQEAAAEQAAKDESGGEETVNVQ